MTEDELSKFLEDNKKDILEAGRQAILDKMKRDMEWNLPATFGDTLSAFLEKEIAPEINKALMKEKGAIIKAVVKASSDIGDAIAAQLIEKASANLTGYRGGEILKKLVD